MVIFNSYVKLPEGKLKPVNGVDSYTDRDRSKVEFFGDRHLDIQNLDRNSAPLGASNAF